MTSTLLTVPRHYLMCRPSHFAVVYAINPWMDTTIPVDRDLALCQWQNLVDTYRSLGHTVEVIEGAPGLPDMVFAANCGTIIGGKALAANMFSALRQGEQAYFRKWLGLNAVSDGSTVVIASQATDLIAKLTARGYRTMPVDLSELLKAGGGVKCCTLELHP